MPIRRIAARAAFIKWENDNGITENYMPAFCACCGAEITKKSEPCPVCGAPTHGMLPEVPLGTLWTKRETSQDEEAACARDAENS